MTRVLVIADDLTGALEAGAHFAAAGLPAVVSADLAGEFDEAVVVLDTETRHAGAAEARRRVAEAAARPAELVYKKTDSTLRGNIRSELGALYAVRGGPLAYVPAYPEMGRTVAGGVVYVNGVPLGESSFARDRLNPVSDSRVASVLDAGWDCEVFDGESAEDVAAAGRLILESRRYRIVAGPSAIAAELAKLMGRSAVVEWPAIRTCLVVNGSLHEASARQVEAARGSGVFSADGWRMLKCPIPPGTAPLDAARLTAGAVERELSETGCDALMVFGGDTAFGVVEELRAWPLRPMGEVLAGVPVSRMEGRREVLITKAGGFGGAELIGQLKNNLR